MTVALCISFRFIQPDPLFHGSRDAGEAEWPPSPLRAYQAILNAASSRCRGKSLPSEVRSALCLLETIRPQIFAPTAGVSVTGHRAYVPHNQYDLISAGLHRGMDPSTEAFRKLVGSIRVEKDYRPIRIRNVDDDLPTVHYLYPLEASGANPQEMLDTIRPSVRAIHCLGWGIDQVVADARLIDGVADPPLTGDLYSPTDRGGRPLRVPRSGTLDALANRHERFLDRITGGNWTPVPPLTTFDRVPYRRNDDPTPRPYAFFRLLDENGETARYPHAKLVHIAGMVRHLALTELMRTGDAPPGVADPAGWLNRFVRGKVQSGDEPQEPHEQLSYIPLPSIGHAHADAMVRNVMLVAPIGCERELEFVAGRIHGGLLSPEGDGGPCETDSKLHGIPESIERFTPPAGKFIANCYLGTSRTWHSVTPVILDGHNDKKDAKTKRLIQTALQRAGVETPCGFTWQAVPFVNNCLSAHKYDRDGRHTGYHRPHHLKDLTAVHVRITFEHPVPGPLALGAGRHCGFGLMAAVPEAG